MIQFLYSSMFYDLGFTFFSEVFLYVRKDDIITTTITKYKDYNRALELGYWNGTMKNSIDITNEWLKKIILIKL